MTRQMGVNMPNLLHLYLGSGPGGAAAARAQMDEARALGITHARFIASGYWPIEMKTGNGWQVNPTAYFAAFDQLVDDAETRGLKLVPSLLFNLWLFPDMAQESMGKLFTPGSATRTLAEAYLTDVVNRYKGRATILFWELGNEANLLADLDMSTCNICGTNTNNCGSLAPSLLTPCMRTTADNFFSCNNCRGVSTTQQDLGAFTQSIATLVKTLDPSRPFATGHGHPREAAMHLAVSPCPACDWTLDSPTQYEQALAQLHPAAVDLVTVHHYPGVDAARFGSNDQAGLGLVTRANAWAKSVGKALYVGEYGQPRAGSINCGGVEVCGGDADQVHTRRIMNTLVKEDVRWSALWAFDFYQFCAGTPTCYTVTSSDALIPDFVLHAQAEGVCAAAADGAACGIGRCAAGVCSAVQAMNFTLDAAGSESTWPYWTNCTACTPGTRTRQTSGSTSYLRLQSNTLGCSGTCSYPGVYAITPFGFVQAGRVLMHAVVRSSAASSTARLMAFDSANAELWAREVPIGQGTAWSTVGAWETLPSNATKVAVRFQLIEPSATLDVDEVGIDWQP